MSLQRNVVANYVGQAYTAVIGLVMVPVYIGYMGTEAYGLVGFFAMLQTWFQLFDMGLTPTLSRELSRYKAGVLRETEASVMMRSLEWFFGFVGACCAAAVAAAAAWIARHWLEARLLSLEELALCVVFMGGMLAPRWLVGLYRGGLAGLEQMAVLNLAAGIFATMRGVGSLAVLHFWSNAPSGFFLCQLVLAWGELVVCRWLFYRKFPMRTAPFWSGFGALRRLAGLAGGMVFLTGLWIVISHTDRLVLSWMLDLQHFGSFTVAVTLAGSIALMAGPLGQSLQPRFAILAANREHERLVALYRTSTQFTSAAVMAVAGVMAYFPRPILQAWTGESGVADEAAKILPLYAIGNAIVAVLSLAFLVQFALGNLRWQIIGNCLFSLIWLPGVYLASRYVGAVGSGWVWLAANLAYLLCWVPYVHRQLMPSLGWRWLVIDIGAIAAVELGMLVLSGMFDWTAMSRAGVIAAAMATTLMIMMAGLLAGTETRPMVLRFIRRILSPTDAKEQS